MKKPLLVNDETIEATAKALGTQIRVVEHGVARAFPREWSASASVTIFRSWCHYSSTHPVTSLPKTASAAGVSADESTFESAQPPSTSSLFSSASVSAVHPPPFSPLEEGETEPFVIGEDSFNR